MTDRIKELLIAKNDGNKSELARAIGVSAQAVQQWFAGETAPRGKNLEKIAKFLHTTPQYLMFGDMQWEPVNQLLAHELSLLRVLSDNGFEVTELMPSSKLEKDLYTLSDGSRYLPDWRVEKEGTVFHVDLKQATSRIFDLNTKQMLDQYPTLLILEHGSIEESLKTLQNRYVYLRSNSELIIRKNTVNIPMLNVAASMGQGVYMQDQETFVSCMTVTGMWLQKFATGSKPDNLALITAYGDSMDPTFKDGDLLLVDRGVDSIKIDAVYVLSLNDELYVKRLQRRPNGSVLMISDNKNYEPYLIENTEKNKFTVLGRVILSWNANNL